MQVNWRFSWKRSVSTVCFSSSVFPLLKANWPAAAICRVALSNSVRVLCSASARVCLSSSTPSKLTVKSDGISAMRSMRVRMLCCRDIARNSWKRWHTICQQGWKSCRSIKERRLDADQVQVKSLGGYRRFGAVGDAQGAENCRHVDFYGAFR
jgi:hypothetical protein